MLTNDVTETIIADLLARVESTPQRIATLATNFDDSRLAQSPLPADWSPLQILSHLRACEEVWMHSVHAILAHDNPRLQEIHPRQWIKTENPYINLPFSSGLQALTLRRQALLIMLRTLALEDWAREGRIAQKTHSVYSRVEQMTHHEEEHLQQLADLLKDLAQ